MPITVSNWGAGFRDFWDNRWLVLRASIIGVFGGFVPAVGASASTWVAYGHAIRSTKDKSKFGKGEIRGIAASEGANNATVIADLVPTLLFSVPGGPAAAIFLGALFSFGYYPGPRMITQNPDLMFLIVWSVALSSVVGAALCFAITPALARLTRIPFGIIAAPLILIMVIGAYQATSTMGDIFMLFGLGALGWMMKHADWPRAPALVGFVLAKPMEQYFWLANQIHGWSWLLRPGVLIIASFIVIPLLLALWRRVRSRGEARADVAAQALDLPDTQDRKAVSLILAALVSVAFAYALWEMTGFNPSSQLMPSLALLPGLPLALWLFPGLIYGAIVFAVVLLLFDILRGDAPTGVLTGFS
jgi:TctA family transporter